MATRDNNYFRKSRQNSFTPTTTSTSLNDVFNNNFNLNKKVNSINSKESITCISNKLVLSDNTMLPNYGVASNYGENNLQGKMKRINISNKHANRNFSSSSKNNINDSSNNSNKSTLELHLKCYENSNEGVESSTNNKNDVEKGDSSRKWRMNAPSLQPINNQNLLIIPRRQQKPDEILKPETAQFKMSQRLYDISQSSNQRRTRSYDSYLPVPFTKGLRPSSDPSSRISNVVIPKSHIISLPQHPPSSSSSLIPTMKCVTTKGILRWKDYPVQIGNIEDTICEETKQRLSIIKNSIIFSSVPFFSGTENDPFGDDDDENDTGFEKQKKMGEMTLEAYIKSIKIDYLKAEKKPDFNCDKKWPFDLRKRDEENFDEIDESFDNLVLQAESSTLSSSSTIRKRPNGESMASTSPPKKQRRI